MSRRAIARTVSATVIGLGALVPAVGVIAAPASAAPSPALAAPLLAANDCCSASLSGLPARFPVGGAPDQFLLTFSNSASQSIGSMQVTFTFSGANLSPNTITMKRMTTGGSWQSLNVSGRGNTVVATDSRFRLGNPLLQGDSTTFQYELSFGSQATPTRVQLGATVSGRAGEHGFGAMSELATTGAQFNVGTIAPPAPKPSVKPTPKSTPTQAAGTSAPANTPPSAPGIDTGPGGPPITPGNAAGSSGTSSLAWVAYIIGALLLLGGIGAIGTLLWRRSSDRIDDDWDEDTAPFDRGSTPGYQAPTAYPTQQLPPRPAPVQAGPPTGPNERPGSYGDPIGGDPIGGAPGEYTRPGVPGRPDDYGRHSADSTRPTPN